MTLWLTPIAALWCTQPVSAVYMVLNLRCKPVTRGVTAAVMRKEGIHPEWFDDAKVICNGQVCSSCTHTPRLHAGLPQYCAAVQLRPAAGLANEEWDAASAYMHAGVTGTCMSSNAARSQACILASS